MGLMAVLRDLYDIQELKMNIKFEIEVLSKHLGIKLDEVTGPLLPCISMSACESSIS